MTNMTISNTLPCLLTPPDTAPEPLTGAALNLPSLLTRFTPISLAEMANVSLLRRSEVKYVLTEQQLYKALVNLTPYYRILEIDRGRLNPYHTLYFDTADFALYRHHHAGGRNRYKVRSRCYVQSGLSFLEVKHKVNGERTHKARQQTDRLATQINAQAAEFVAAHAPLATQQLEPKLWNSYRRITLVSRYRPERLTLDLGLQWGWGETAVSLPGITIAEVKQNHRHHQSDFVRQLHDQHLRPNGLSKYCLGVALLYPNVKHNRFKPKLRLLTQLIQETSKR